MTQEYVWLITGANRGIGLEMVKQLLQTPSNTVIAACRSPTKATELQELVEHVSGGKLHVVALDVTSKESVHQAAEDVARILGGRGIDYLVNNAGILPGGLDTAFTMDVEVMQEAFATNVAGTAYVTQAFIGAVEKSAKKTVVNVSSTFGGIGADQGVRAGVAASYAISKAGLNMLTYKEAKEKPDIVAIAICPGWVQTDMGGENAMYPVSVSVSGVVKTVLALQPSDSGKFLNFEGEIIPW
ncbi:NAD-P-binding protein [Lentinus tigrinus ALCF2SS1-7]|uniref:NAD-P-binding protein n=1 Tax=Lentinus tigrinus ALCF2SS1-6 TaxID=1328759 RepID=A0A5C2RSP6_9APHY|nr:NAD-P-binding protein [Lentinus tigrinus ALCF2SS1-6]RPD73841.1 NAD-P-binding protein [Lentinus tigrinus ALCF2SS1-7]